MPQTVAEADNFYRRDWTKWPVPQMPALTPTPWSGVEGCFWSQSIMHSEVDEQRTAKLDAVNIPVSGGAGNPPYQGSSYGQPLQLVDSTKTFKVLDKTRPVTWKWFRPQYPLVDLPLPPEPDKVRREGDPVGAFDKHWYAYDGTAGILYEVIQLNTGATIGGTRWSVGYNGGSNPVSIWDTRRPWNAPGQARGVVAAGVPVTPMILKYEEYEARNIGHSLCGAFPNYCAGMTGPARGYDGDIPDHPVRAGERLRLKAEFVGGDAKDDPIAYAAHEYGFMCTDRNAWNKGDYRGVAGFTSTQDVRWQSVTFPKWQLNQFEVVAQ